MTTYSYTLVLNDREMIALEAAMAHYRKLCDRALRSGPSAPYLAHREALKRIELKLWENATLTSTSTFCDDGGGNSSVERAEDG
jgi:hypothetical protein